MTSIRAELLREVEQLLYREARLLDERRFQAWLELFTDDVRYWAPVRSTRYPRRSKAIAMLARDRHEEDELGKATDLAIFDETKETLTRRIARLDTGMAWSEDPPSRTRHLISNIEVEPGATEAELVVHSNFLVFRSRGETDQDTYIGGRQDTLRNVDGTWKIARRTIVLDQNVLLAKNVSVFF